MNELVVWGVMRFSGVHNLKLTVSRTKELVVDFGRDGKALSPRTITGPEVERADSLTFLGNNDPLLSETG